MNIYFEDGLVNSFTTFILPLPYSWKSLYMNGKDILNSNNDKKWVHATGHVFVWLLVHVHSRLFSSYDRSQTFSDTLVLSLTLSRVSYACQSFAFNLLFINFYLLMTSFKDKDSQCLARRLTNMCQNMIFCDWASVQRFIYVTHKCFLKLWYNLINEIPNNKTCYSLTFC